MIQQQGKVDCTTKLRFVWRSNDEFLNETSFLNRKRNTNVSKEKANQDFLNKVMQIVIAMLNKSSEIHLNAIGERTLCTDLSVNFKTA